MTVIEPRFLKHAAQMAPLPPKPEKRLELCIISGMPSRLPPCWSLQAEKIPLRFCSGHIHVLARMDELPVHSLDQPCPGWGSLWSRCAGDVRLSVSPRSRSLRARFDRSHRFNYIIDVYLWAAASALAATTVVRSIFGAGFPLFATQI